MGFFKVFSKRRPKIWFHLLVKEDIIILHIRAKFRVQAIFCSRDIVSNGGQNGSKMGFFEFFSKTALAISFFFSYREKILQ